MKPVLSIIFLTVVAGCAQPNAQAIPPDATMGSAMFTDATGSYFLGGYNLPDGYAASLGDEVTDLSGSDPSGWPVN